MKKLVVVLSGGLDSTTLLYDMCRFNETYAISFSYGQRHKVKELDAAKVTCAKLGIPHKIVYLDSLREVLGGSALTDDNIVVPEGHYEEESMKLTVVPNRNMILLSVAIGYAVSIKANEVAYAAHGGDHSVYPDCRPEFVDGMNIVARLCDWHKVKVNAPYIRFNKGDIVKIGKQLGVDYAHTWTCYKGGEVPCGKCGACNERAEAFKDAGMEDPLLKGVINEERS